MTAEIRMLGPLQVVVDGTGVSLPQGRARALLALLALEAGRAVFTDVLIDRLWGPEPPPTARTKVHGLISELRTRIGSGENADPATEPIKTIPGGYVLHIGDGAVDTDQFRRMVESARDLPALERSSVLGAALELWRGPALADFAYEPFAQNEIAALETLRLRALEDKFDAQLELGAHHELLPELEVLVAKNPFRERMRSQAMIAHYRSGNQHRALALYHEAYETFGEELGIEPGPELSSLELAILNHDPGLMSSKGSPTRIASDSIDGSWLDEMRKVVTTVFIELTQRGSPDRPDVETTRIGAKEAHEIVAGSIRNHGGEVMGFIGGITVGVFGIPAVHEDDPLRAVRSALEARQDVSTSDDLDGGFDLRVGINTGEIVVGQPALTGADLSGDTIRWATTLQQSARPGEILIGARTRDLLGERIKTRLADDLSPDESDLSRRVFSLLSIEPTVEVPTRSFPPMVGREAEEDRVGRALARAEEGRRAFRLTISGDPGIGKTRLASETLGGRGRRVRAVTGHCLSYGEGITFWALGEIVDGIAGGLDQDLIENAVGSVEDARDIASQVAATVGSGTAPARADQLFPAMRRFFEAVSSDHPLVVILEDFQWAQTTLVELVEYLADTVSGKLLVVCLVRPEFLEQWPSWRKITAVTDHIELDSLDPASARELCYELGRRQGLGTEQILRAADLAEGNPLFVEQILAAMAENDETDVPASIEHLLVTRLDRLGPAQLDMIRSASVLGKLFAVDDLLAIVPIGARRSGRDHLDSLSDRNLIEAVDEEHFRFRHSLIQMVAYQTITKRARASLHQEAGLLIEGERKRHDLARLDEMIGFHFDRAANYRRELGDSSAETDELAKIAGEHLFRAGRRAFEKLDAMAAEYLLQRAVAQLPLGHANRDEARRHLALTYQVMGRHDQAEPLLLDLADQAGRENDEVLEKFLGLEAIWARMARGPDPLDLRSIEQQAAEAEDTFREHGHPHGLAQVARVRLHVHLRRGEISEVERLAYAEIEHAGRSGSTREELAGPLLLGIALTLGPRRVDDCIARLEEVADWQDTQNPGVVSSLGHLEAMRGDFDRARELIESAHQILRERIRARRPSGNVYRLAGEVELLSGDLDAAETVLREALQLNTQMGEGEMISELSALLARVAFSRGDVEKAVGFADESHRTAPRESVIAQTMWRSVEARVMALQGRLDEAERLVREAVALSPDEMPNLRAEVTVDLAHVLLGSAPDGPAAEALDEAIALYEEKGNLVAARSVRAIQAVI